jgi:hypothetical protein
MRLIMANHHKVFRVDTHRALMLNEAIADEVGKAPDMHERQGRGPVPKYTGPRNKPSKAAKFVFGLVGAVLGVVLAWHLLLQLASQVAP